MIALIDLAKACGLLDVPARSSRMVRGVAYDSRRVTDGDLFVALRGERHDGGAFASEALGRGAVAVASQVRPDGVDAADWVSVPDARRFLAQAARVVLRTAPIPRLVGVTGTKGKTTCALWIHHVLNACGRKAGALGTVTYHLGSREIPAGRTTPEAPDVEGYLKEMSAAGLEDCVMEVSSHAVALERVAELPFEMAIFTNLGRDHLDFHRDEESYFAAKRSLFERLPASGVAIVNVDDARGDAVRAAAPCRAITYGRRPDADVRIASVRETLDGIEVDVAIGGSRIVVASPLLGDANARNLAAVLAASVGLGIPVAEAARAIGTFAGAPGRLEPVRAGQPFLCLVDYAHTPESLETSLAACRSLAAKAGGRVIAVMGCGGDRDRGKRPLMGAAAARGSDVLVVTSDNPRSEDPLKIILDVEVGIRKLDPPAAPYRVLPDRREAIAAAVEAARPGDVVLIAGKGHERVQIWKGGTIPFDDRQVAIEEIRRLSVKGGAS